MFYSAIFIRIAKVRVDQTIVFYNHKNSKYMKAFSLKNYAYQLIQMLPDSIEHQIVGLDQL